VTNGPVYLTNIVCYFTTNEGWTVGFDIAGGTNGVPYDIFTTTELLGDHITNALWAWQDVGYTCNSYTFTNQPTNQTFYILGTPLDTDGDGLTDAFEQLVSKTLISTNDTDGDGMPDKWEWENGLNPLVNDADDDPDGDWITNLQEYNGGTNSSNPHDWMVVAWGDNSDGQCNVPLYLRNVKAIAAGDDFSLALRTDGTVVAWGANDGGQTNAPADLTNAVAISANFRHAVAVRSNGTISLWGVWWHGADYSLYQPSDLTNAVFAAAGASHDLAVRSNGTVTAWSPFGSTPYTTIPTNVVSPTSLAAGYSHSVAVSSSGAVVAWGENLSIPFGWNVTNVPAGLSNVMSVAAGDYHTLALKANGTVTAWGAGQTIGPYFADLGQSIVPTGLSNIVAVAASGYHSLALRADGSVVAWGDLAAPGFLQSNVLAIATGLGHGLAIRSGRLTPIILKQPTDQFAPAGSNVTFTAQALGLAEMRYQWQFNGTNIAHATNATLTLNNIQTNNQGNYQVVFSTGAGSLTSSVASFTLITPPVILAQTQPERQWAPASPLLRLTVEASGLFLHYQWQTNGTPVTGATLSNYSVFTFDGSAERQYSVIVSNAAGFTNSQAWKVRAYRSGGVAPWGSDDYGQLVWPTNATNVVQLAAGEFHSVAVREDGRVVQWGYEWDAVPADLTNAVAVAAGYDHTLALRDNGTVTVWGDPDSYAFWIPTNLNGVKAVSAGWYHDLALLTNGNVIAWGANLATLGWHLTEVPTDLTNATAIAAGAQHSLALRSDGTVVAWGDNDVGQTNVPGGLSNVVGIAAGGIHSLALKADGTVTAWGLNTSGQCSVPSGLSNVMAVAAGWAHSVALKNDGTAVCWGDNSNGQTNVGAGLIGIKSIAAGGDHTLAAIFSPLAQYPVDVTKDLLLIYNTNSTDSSNVWYYYKQHRPLATGANSLGIGCPTNEYITPSTFTNQILTPYRAWFDANPTKRPQYVVAFLGIPARVRETTNAYDSVFYQLHAKTPGIRPFVTTINMDGTNDCIAYINKLAAFGTNGQVLISASAGNYGNTNYVVDDVHHEDYLFDDHVSRATNGLAAAQVSPLAILFRRELEPCINGLLGRDADSACTNGYEAKLHLTNAVNVAGYISWGSHSELRNFYALPYGAVKWQGNSTWWIIQTIESYNGARDNTMGNFLQWFSATAFGGTDYSNTPVGAITHVDEPGLSGVSSADTYFNLWARKKSFAIAAWNSRGTEFFQAVGDPLVIK
jgi:alpha-tubulin suppressor-like RCC1 family protein